jgi:hypothetical protein
VLRLGNRNHLPRQKDTFSCGVAILVLQNFVHNENKALRFDSRSRRDKQPWSLWKTRQHTHKLNMLFPEDFFEPVPTKWSSMGKLFGLLAERVKCVVWLHG